MENEISSSEVHDVAEGGIAALMERLSVVVELLERAAPRSEMAASAISAEAIGPIVAMVEGGSREAELTHKLATAEKTIADLRAQSNSQHQAMLPSREGRRTLPVSLLAKQDGTTPEPGALDAALTSLSLEQRIAVKAQLLRSGLV